MDTIDIQVSQHMDYTIFSLRPRTREKLAQLFPEFQAIPRVTLDHSADAGFTAFSESIKKQVVSLLLSGLPLERLSEHGIAWVRFWDPLEDKTLGEPYLKAS